MVKFSIYFHSPFHRLYYIFVLEVFLNQIWGVESFLFFYFLFFISDRNRQFLIRSEWLTFNLWLNFISISILHFIAYIVYLFWRFFSIKYEELKDKTINWILSVPIILAVVYNFCFRLRENFAIFWVVSQIVRDGFLTRFCNFYSNFFILSDLKRTRSKICGFERKVYKVYYGMTSGNEGLPFGQ